MDAIVVRQLLILPGRGIASLGFGTDVVKPIIKIFIGMNRILFQQVVKIAFGVVVGRRQIFGKEDVDGQRLRKGGHHMLAGL